MHGLYQWQGQSEVDNDYEPSTPGRLLSAGIVRRIRTYGSCWRGCICSGWAGSQAVCAACRHSKASAEQQQAAGRPGPSQVLYIVSMARSLLEAKQDGQGCPAVDVTQVACAAAEVYRLTRQVGGSRRSLVHAAAS